MTIEHIAAVALAQIAAPPAPTPPPPAVFGATMPERGPPPAPAIVEFGLAEVRCRGEVEVAELAVKPLPSSTFMTPERPSPRFQIAFRIAADGRPLGIGQPNRAERQPSFYLSNDDLVPALAASRFKPGAERVGCVASYDTVVTPVATADPEQLHRYLALPRLSGPAYRPVFERLRAEAASCFTPEPPHPLLQGYPDFDAIPQPAGTLAYSMVGFDIDTRGVPNRVRTLSSDGNAAFDRAAVAAIAKSRFRAQPRTGCFYPYFRRQAAPTPPPPPPESESFKVAGANCDNKVPWAKTPVLVFPEPFRKRAIEGWAVVRYDVAPWGATGKIEVLAAEPAAAFGDAARSVIAGATRAPSPAGATGCVDRVRFKMADVGQAANTLDVPPPF